MKIELKICIIGIKFKNFVKIKINKYRTWKNSKENFKKIYKSLVFYIVMIWKVLRKALLKLSQFLSCGPLRFPPYKPDPRSVNTTKKIIRSKAALMTYLGCWSWIGRALWISEWTKCIAAGAGCGPLSKPSCTWRLEALWKPSSSRW